MPLIHFSQERQKLKFREIMKLEKVNVFYPYTCLQHFWNTFSKLLFDTAQLQEVNHTGIFKHKSCDLSRSCTYKICIKNN